MTVVTSGRLHHRGRAQENVLSQAVLHVQVFIRFPRKEENSLEGLVETRGRPLSREASIPAPEHTACIHSSSPRILRPAGCLRAQERRERTAQALSTSQFRVIAAVLLPGSTRSTRPHPGAQQEPAAQGWPARTFTQGFAPWAGPFSPGSPSGGKAQAGPPPGEADPVSVSAATRALILHKGFWPPAEGTGHGSERSAPSPRCPPCHRRRTPGEYWGAHPQHAGRGPARRSQPARQGPTVSPHFRW